MLSAKVHCTPSPTYLPVLHLIFEEIVVFDVDLREEHKSYMEWSKDQSPQDAKPFLDEISAIGTEVVNSITTSGMLDSAGWGLSIRRGRVIINDVRHVVNTEELNSDDEPF